MVGLSLSISHFSFNLLGLRSRQAPFLSSSKMVLTALYRARITIWPGASQGSSAKLRNFLSCCPRSCVLPSSCAIVLSEHTSTSTWWLSPGPGSAPRPTTPPPPPGPCHRRPVLSCSCLPHDHLAVTEQSEFDHLGRKGSYGKNSIRNSISPTSAWSLSSDYRG